MALRFHPPIWFEAAQWCFDNSLKDEGAVFLDQGLEANPESCLLAFRKADHLEQTTPAGDGDEGKTSRGKIAREPYDALLLALYKHCDKVEHTEKVGLARIEERYAAMSPDSRDGSPEAATEEPVNMDASTTVPSSKKAQRAQEVQLFKAASKFQSDMVKRTLTFAWIGLVRLMRRIQGKGQLDHALPGLRGTYSEARRRGRLSVDIHSAVALLEHHCYRDPAASRIFGLGTKLHPDDENHALEHIKFLISTGDTTSESDHSFAEANPS